MLRNISMPRKSNVASDHDFHFFSSKVSSFSFHSVTFVTVQPVNHTYVAIVDEIVEKNRF